MIGTNRFKSNKATLSNWMILIFLLTVVISGAISEFFQNPNQPAQDLIRYQSLFENEQIARINEIELTNQLGTYRFEKVTGLGGNPWELVFPRRFAANQEVVKSMLDAILGIKIRKIYPQDPINISNYSLDSPLITLSLIDADGEKHMLKIGLVNPIDNSTYVSITGQEAIYHVDAIKYQMETLSLTDFIDSTIFTLKPEEIASLKIYRGSSKLGQVGFSVSFKEDKWVDRNGREIDPAKLFEFFGQILAIKSLFILDKSSEELEKELEKQLTRPLYTIEIEDKQKNYYSYILTNVVKSLPEVKMEKWQNFLITASNRKHPYLLNKEILKMFAQSESKFKKLQIKKLFY